MHDIEKLKEEMLSDERVNTWLAKLEFERKLARRYIDWFAAQTIQERDRIIRLIKEKYESDAYKDREYRLGYEPRCTLMWLLDDYADLYGKSLPQDPDNPFDHHNNLIDNKWVVTVMHGQGSVIHVSEYDDNKRAIDEITEQQESVLSKLKKNPILKINDSALPNICGYSLIGFFDEDTRKSMRFAEDYIYEHCRYWGFFGDGLCFTCTCGEDVCPFKDVRPDNLPAEEILSKHGRNKK